MRCSQSLGGLRQVMPNSRAYEPLGVELQEDFAELLEWNAIRAVSGKGFIRADLLAQFRRIEALCPEAEYELKRVREVAGCLEKQIQEDSAHSAISAAEFAKLSPADQAAELVYRLRDETAQGVSDWPFADSHERMPSNGSYAGLVNLGFGAAPALIAALDQEGNTRSVVATMRYGGVAGLLSIHDAAIAALNDIAGINFYWQVPNWGMMKREESEPAVREQIEGWWKDVRQKGEEAYLVAKLNTEGNALNIGQRLMARFPETGAREIIKAAEASSDGRRRSVWIKLLWKHDTPECRAFFERELRGGPTLGNRVAAAYGLRLLGDSQAVSAMREEWSRIVGRTSLSSSGPLQPGDAPESPVHVAAFLASGAAPEGIYALGPDSGRLPAQWSARVMEFLADRLSNNYMEATEPATPATKLAIQDVLVSFLSDSTPCDESFGWRRLQVIRARLCDYAGVYLHKLWPDKYPFESGLSPSARDRQCIQCRNARSRETGEAILPLPEPLPVKRLSPSAACEIVRVEWEAGSAALAGAWRAKADTLRGRRLEGEAMVSLLKSFLKNPADRVSGISVDMIRYADLTGVTLSIRLLPGATITHGAQCRYDFTGVYESGGGAWKIGELGDPAQWKRLRHEIAAVSESDPKRAFEIRFAIATE